MPSATALAHPNIALIKYWGKRDETNNLPAVGSLSVTLDALLTRTTVTFEPTLARDELILNGEINGLKDVMAKSLDQGMVTFDEALFRLYRDGKISEAEALRNADSVNNLRLKIKLADEGGLEGSGGGLQLEDQ